MATVSTLVSESLLARIIHDGSLQNRKVALRDGRAEPRRREAYSLQYVDRLSGEPARHTKLRLNRRVRSDRGGEVFYHRLRMQACRSSEFAIAAEVFMNDPG